MKTCYLILLTVCIANGVTRAWAEQEVTGRVSRVDTGQVEVTLDGGATPPVGGSATLNFTIPGSEDEVTVATGVVASVEGTTAQVRINEKFGDPAEGQIVRFTAPSPATVPPPQQAISTPAALGTPIATPVVPLTPVATPTGEGIVVEPAMSATPPPPTTLRPLPTARPLGDDSMVADLPVPLVDIPVPHINATVPDAMLAERAPSIYKRQVLFLDMFHKHRGDGPCSIGKNNDGSGGSKGIYYIPIFAGPDGSPTGAVKGSFGLINPGMDFGGVMFTRSPKPCGNARGDDFGQNLMIQMQVRFNKPSDGISTVGPYVRTRPAAAGDGLIGPGADGYWVQLCSNGQVRVLSLNWNKYLAVSRVSPLFKTGDFHQIQAWFHGPQLAVYLDGQPVEFLQSSEWTRLVYLHKTAGENQGCAGFAFGAQDNRGRAGGQEVLDILVARTSS